jgi:putative DNA primase/helicase
MKIRNRKSISIKLKAIAEDEASGEFLAIIKFRDIDGNYRRLTLPLSDLDDPKALGKTLKNAGCRFSRNPEKNATALMNLTESSEQAERWKFAPCTGWYNGHRAFVHPRRIIGRPRRDALIKPPRDYAGNHNSALKISGSHKKWIKNVAIPAQSSSRIVLGICMSLAAPLLTFAKLNSFGVHIHGPGKAGKSTLLVVAGSVNGFGSEDNLPNFRTTDAAFGEIPASFNDMLLPMNELGLLKGRKVERSERIRDLSYGFAEGRGTTYSKFAPIKKSDAERRWRSIFMGTGEEAIEEISEAAGQTRTVGAQIRLFDLRATRKEAEDLFDFCPKTVTEENRKAWVQQQCVALRTACRTHRGVALKHFIEHVINNRRTIPADLSALTKRFVDDVIDQNEVPAVRHLATCLAHIAAAGRLGARFKTVPWSEKFVIKCIKRCYRDARRALRTESDLLHEGLRVLKNEVHGSKMLKVTRKARYSADAWKAADGYWEKASFGTRATIRGKAFKDWFPDRRQSAIVLRWLRSKNALTLKRRSAVKSGSSVTWAESHVTWPNGSRRRSIVIDLHPDVFREAKK